MAAITRRDAAWAIARAAAVAANQDFFSAWVRAAQAHGAHSIAPPERDRWSYYKPQFFSAMEFQMLDAFTAILIPADDTPGAREAHVAHFIDFVVNAADEFAPEMQTDWRRAMNWLTAHDFAALGDAERLAMMERMAAPEIDPAKEHDGFPVYRLIKDMAVRAFYTSRAGLIGDLEYKGLAWLTEFPGCHHPEHRKA